MFVDGFAGPGRYEGGEPGSPVIAIRVALNHSARLPVPIRFLFIEQRYDRYEVLQQELAKWREETSRSSIVRLSDPLLGNCTEELSRVIDEYQLTGRRFGPAMVFLDQFGFSQVPMQLIRRILNFPQCEVLSYLEYRRLTQFLSDNSKQAGITETWGSDDWRPALKLRGGLRRNFLKESYKRALQNRANARFVLDFAMCGEDGTVLYWLFFCTNNIRGIEEMKRAMWNLDDSGDFRFSDRANPDQLLLIEGCTQEWLAGELSARLDQRTMTVRNVYDFVLTETPCYRFKDALKLLEKRRRLTVIDPAPGRRTGTFARENMQVVFARD